MHWITSLWTEFGLSLCSQDEIFIFKDRKAYFGCGSYTPSRGVPLVKKEGSGPQFD